MRACSELQCQGSAAKLGVKYDDVLMFTGRGCVRVGVLQLNNTFKDQCAAINCGHAASLVEDIDAGTRNQRAEHEHVSASHSLMQVWQSGGFAVRHEVQGAELRCQVVCWRTDCFQYRFRSRRCFHELACAAHASS